MVDLGFEIDAAAGDVVTPRLGHLAGADAQPQRGDRRFAGTFDADRLADETLTGRDTGQAPAEAAAQIQLQRAIDGLSFADAEQLPVALQREREDGGKAELTIVVVRSQLAARDRAQHG